MAKSNDTYHCLKCIDGKHNKEWLISTKPRRGKFKVWYGRAHTRLRLQTIPGNGKSDSQLINEIQKRMDEKLNVKGYTYLGQATVDGSRRPQLVGSQASAPEPDVSSVDDNAPDDAVIDDSHILYVAIDSFNDVANRELFDDLVGLGNDMINDGHAVEVQAGEHSVMVSAGEDDWLGLRTEDSDQEPLYQRAAGSYVFSIDPGKQPMAFHLCLGLAKSLPGVVNVSQGSEAIDQFPIQDTSIITGWDDNLAQAAGLIRRKLDFSSLSAA